MTRRDLVVVSLESWDGVWRRNQYLVDGLLRADPGLHVLFVEPARDMLHDAMRRQRPRRGAGHRVADGYDGRLVLFQPTKWLPRIAGPAADRMLHRGLRDAVRRVGAARPALWINDPAWASLLLRVDWPALYDMTDDWLAADRSARAHDRLVVGEDILLDACAAVVVCSPGLEASRRRRRPDVVLIPNAVDVARYRTPVPRPEDLPADPVAVYAGTLHEDRLDVETVLGTGRALHEVGGSCVLVGPDNLSPEHSAALRTAPGVTVLGARDFTTIPGYLQHAGALIVPHVVNRFTESLDPLKLYEYRAVGRPIVSTPVAGFHELDGEPGITVVDAAGFPEAVVAATSSPATAAASVPDWDDRVRAMGDVIDRIRSA